VAVVVADVVTWATATTTATTSCLVRDSGGVYLRLLRALLRAKKATFSSDTVMSMFST
jgi:hypothetical protein